MPRPEDQQFFENLNRDLATQLSSAIKDALEPAFGAGVRDTSIRSLTSTTMKGIGEAVARSMKDAFGDPKEWGVGSGDGKGPKEKEPKEDSPQGRQWKKFTKSMVAMIAQSKLAAKAASALNDTQAFGNMMAKGATVTNNKGILGTKFLSDKFEQFGIRLPEIGGMFEGALRAGAGPITTSQGELLASTHLFGANVEAQNTLQGKSVHVMGLNTKQSEHLGSDILHLAKQNGIFADSILEAAVAMEGTVKALNVAQGGAMTEQWMAGAIRLHAATKGVKTEDVNSLLGSIAQTDIDKVLKLRGFAGIAGGNGGDLRELMRTDPRAYQAQMVTLIGELATKLEGGTDFDLVMQKEVMQGLGGLNTGAILAAKQLFQNLGPQGIQEALGREITDAEKAKIEAAMAKDQLAASTDLQDGMMANVIATQNLTTALDIFRLRFDAISTSLSEPFRDTTVAAGTGAGLMSMVAPTVSAGVNLLALRALLGRGAAAAPAAAAGGGGAAAARGGMLAGLGGGLGRLLSPAYTEARQLGMMGRNAKGQFVKGLGPSQRLARGRAAGNRMLGAGSKRIPLIGSLLAGGMQYGASKQEGGGDVSRAIAAGGGAGLGMWGGAAAGAALGSIVPVIGTGVGAILGAIAGGIIGQKTAVGIHDQFDPVTGTRLTAAAPGTTDPALASITPHASILPDSLSSASMASFFKDEIRVMSSKLSEIQINTQDNALTSADRRVIADKSLEEQRRLRGSVTPRERDLASLDEWPAPSTLIGGEAASLDVG